MCLSSELDNSVATALAQGLRESGIDVVFGLPGGENVHLMDAMRRAGIRFVLSEHENAAAFMAASVSQITRKPAACLTTLGPGAVNCTAGVAHAFLDRCPILVITAQMTPDLQDRHTHQFIDLHRLFEPITKATLDVTPSTAATVIRDALHIATAGMPGPVHLQVPNDVARVAVEITELSEASATVTEVCPSITEADLTKAANSLTLAERPVVVVGLGLEPEGPYVELRDFAERLAAPVLSTPKAKGSLPASHVLCSETIGVTRTDPGYELIAEADLVIAIGVDVVELVLPWSVEAPIIWIAPWADPIGVATAEQRLLGPVGLTLLDLIERFPKSGSNWGVDRSCQYAQARHRRSRDAAVRASPGTIAPQIVLREAQGVMPANVTVTTDVGSHKILAALEWEVELPNRYLVSNGLSAMGFGLSSASGAALVGHSPVLCLIGDAGLLMCAGGLATVAQLSTPVLIVVFVDGALDLIRAHQQRSVFHTFGTEFPAPDIDGIGAAFGLPAVTVGTGGDLRTELARGLKRSGASVIGVKIDSDCYRGSF